MIIQEVEAYFANRKRLSIEHRDSIYVTNVSCDKIIDKESGFTKVCGTCTRAAYYSCIGAGEGGVGRNRDMARKLGDFTEYMLLKILEDNKTLVEKAVKFTIDDYRISGKLDAIITVDDAQAGLEIKSLSANEWTINSIFGSRWNKPAPKIEHLLQCMVYLYAYRGTIDTFYLVYIRRDNGDLKEFKLELVLVDGVLYPSIDGNVYYDVNCNNILDRARKLKNYIDTDIVPPRDYSIVYRKDYLDKLLRHNIVFKKRYDKFFDEPFGDIECMGCGYKDLCVKDGER